MIAYYILDLKQKKIHNIIIRRVMSIHMGPMYNETLCIYFESYEWWCLQISSDAKYFSSLVQGIVIVDWYYLPTPPLGQDMTQGQVFLLLD